LSNLPIISVGLVNKLSTSTKFLTKIISDPKTISIDTNENNTKLIIKLIYFMDDFKVTKITKHFPITNEVL